MNTLIQSLARQAQQSIPENTLGVDKWIETYNQRFAVLLIRECCTAIESTDRYRSDYFISKVRQHFGVEE